MIYGHVDDASQFSTPIKANFSTTIWHGNSLNGLKLHIFNIRDKVKSYPEASAERLRLDLSVYLNIVIKQ